MTDSQKKTPDSVQLPGSERARARAAEGTGEPADADQIIEVTLILRRQEPIPAESLVRPMAHEDFAARHGASSSDLDLVTGTLTDLGARIIESDAASRRVRISGTVDLLSRLFGTSLENVTSRAPDGNATVHRQRTGFLTVPAALDGVVTAVLGLDDRPQARAQFKPAAAAPVSYTPPELGKVYGFPPQTDGSGHIISILELGGGYIDADLATYFQGLGIPAPSVSAVGVDGGTNQPINDPNSADGEVMLDIEVAGALAPKAEIIVYFAPNTDAGFVDALSAAAHASPAPTAISISWGQSEDDWTQQALTAFDQALADAAALGVTVTAAAGDNGSPDGATDGKDHADFPASSPHALACGGTRLEADPATGTITSETVWNENPHSATGGGYSDKFPVPPWQSGVVSAGKNGKKHPKKRGRGVPDVSGVADPQTGYKVRVDGQDLVFGGTSAVAPLWAALTVRLAQAAGHRFGLLQPALYNTTGPGKPAAGFRDITNGNNGTFRASAGWDPCTGLGSPDGTALLKLIRGSG
ncbi:S53 family peptidase [Arthrobacter sp. LAPM80]|uniref:S53 family peptidase n=1 Tax=Arthrobacter sp. LAPM80 TaxID=3141788 RepID=UPI00398AC0C7